MTDIVNIPEGVLSSDFPSNADRTAGVFNQKSYDWAESARAMSARDREIAVAARTNALAANERAVTASSEADRATTQANAAASSASAASGYASAASTSASNAATSASAAESASIEASKLNLGNKATPPTLDNQGQPLRAGATYYDTTLNKWRVWDGVSWAEGISAVAGVASVAGKTGDLDLSDTSYPAATQSEMEAGTEPAMRSMSPELVAQAIGALAGSKILRSARTSNVQLVKADNGKLIDITSGTFTQTFAAASSLGDGWFCYLKNSGTGDITLDPNASELIDGLTSYIMYPGEVRLVQCDGAALRSVVMNSFYKTFTESGEFTKPPGYTSFEGVLWGGGGSGAKYSTLNGGGGGAAVAFAFSQSIFASSETITIAASSTGPSVTGAGAQGNNSTLGALVVSYGGTGGSATTTRGGAGGGWLSAAQLDVNAGGAPTAGTNGGATFGGGAGAGASNAGGGASIYGGGGGGTGTGAGGSSIYGGAGGGATGGISTHGGAGGVSMAGSSGGDGVAPGGGGGGTTSGAKAGNGARGELRIWGII